MEDIPKVIFHSNIAPKSPNFGKLSDFLATRTTKSIFNIDQEFLRMVHGFSGLKHIMARENFLQLEKDYRRYFRNAKFLPAKKTSDNKGRLTFDTRTLIPLVKSLDNFVNELYGYLDFFSRELDIIFNLNIGIKSDFEKIYKEINKIHNKDQLTKDIIKFHNSNEYKYLHGLRIRLIHWYPLTFRSHKKHLLLPDNPWEPINLPKSDNKVRFIPRSKELLFYTLNSIDHICYLIGRKLFIGWGKELKR
ncbi:MAG: hypothetical protein HYT70_03035 [Candidatus Aenigmarchaeota archaeon]|nr:hypothetical protein [Candidatus Aenigmarchaeota archaeon]